MRLRAHGFRVALIERSTSPRRCLVELLPVDAEPFLVRAEAWARVRAAALWPAPGIASVWGEETIGMLDCISSMRAPAWYVDRQAFDGCLLQLARDAGVKVEVGAAVTRIERRPDGCVLVTRCAGQSARVSCQYVVDATGRLSGPLRGPQIRLDRLVAVTMTSQAALRDPLREWPLVEACRIGWWCSTLTREGGSSTTLFTDPDLLPAGQPRSMPWSSDAPHTLTRAAGTGHVRVVPSWSRYTATATDGRVFAVGDAAMAMDPLSGRGLAAALRSAVAAADAIAEARNGNDEPARVFADDHIERTRAYAATRRMYYATETRWRDDVFWARRRVNASAENG
jgi:flavin-dependent dehydrogenase